MRSESTLARWLNQVRQSLGSSATLARGKARRERAVRQLRAHNQTAEPWLAEERQLLSAPAVVLSVTDATYTENAPPVTLDPAVTASDPDADFITGAQVKITDYEMGQDQLSFTSNHGITGSFDNTTGILTLNGVATASQYASVLSSVQYQNLSENPTDLQRTIEFRITDTEPSTSAPATLTLNLVPVADTPPDVVATVDEDTLSGPILLAPNPNDGTSVTYYRITDITGGTLYHADGITQVNDGDFITAAEAENFGFKFQGNTNYFGAASFKFQAATGNTLADLGGAKATANITVDPVADTPADVAASVDEDTLSTPIILAPNPVDGASVTHYQITGITNGTLYYNDGITEIQNGDFITAADATAGLKFQGNNNYFGAASFKFQAATGGTIGDLGGGLATAIITVNSVNDDPTITGPGAQTVDEGSVLTFSNATLNPITINDVDAASNILTVEIQATGPAATYTLGSTSGITFVQGTNGGTTPLIIQGTLSDLQAALNGLQVQPQDNGTLDLTFIVTDEALASDQVLVPITVNNVAPTLTLTGPAPNTVNEGAFVTVTGSATDPANQPTTLNDNDPLTYTWSVTKDGNAYASGMGSVANFQVDDNAQYIVTMTVTDGDGGSDSETYTIDVANVAPTLTLNPVSAVDENGVATLTGTITDPGTADTFTLDVDWGDGTAPVTYVFAAGTTNFSVTHQYLDDNPTNTSSDPYTISATLTDDDTGSDTKTTTVTVNNVAPVLTLNPVIAVDENGVATLSGTYTDTGTQDTHTLAINWGDGSPVQTVVVSGGTFSVTHQYLDDNPTNTSSDPYTISATLTDDDTGSDTKTTTVTVNNVAPVLTLNPVMTVNENGVATLSGTYTDTGTQDTHTLAINWGDGSPVQNVVVTGGTFSVTHQYLDDNPTNTSSDNYTISATLTDDDTGADTKTTTVTVNNVAPVLTLNPVMTVDENGIATLSGTYTDTGTQDTHTLAINWGDGSPVQTVVVSGGTFSVTHQYLDDNPTNTSSDPYTISATLTDDDTGSDTKTTTVTVNNVAPVLTLNPVMTVNENGVATLSGTYTDTGTQDTHTLAINWGDGSPVQTVVVSGGTFSVTHQYLDDNPTNTSSDPYTISATLTDDDTGADTKTTSVTVNNVAPVLTLNSVMTVDENGIATLSGAYTDTGTQDTHTLAINWGDGSPVQTITVTGGTFSVTHQYLDDNPTNTSSDPYTISATLTDDDTGSDSKTTTVTVNNVAPVLTLNPVMTVNENGVATLSGTYTDTGTQDTHTLAINWGDGSPVQTVVVSGGTFSVTHQYLDDNPTNTSSDTYTISATLTDDDTGADTKTTTVTVNNVAPVLTLNPVMTVDENGVATLSGTYTDTGTQDTHTLAINWGDGSPVQTVVVSGGTFSVTHQYLDDNPTNTSSDPYTISATLTDDDTGSDTKTTTVTVNNVAPVLTLNPVTTINENGVATLSGTIVDPGTADTFTLDVDWGDGTAPVTYVFAAGTTNFSVTHQYLDDNPTNTSSDPYTISATLTDDDLGVDTKTTTVTVNNVAPVLVLNPVTAVDENGVATLSGTITDPGTKDTFTLVVDWGDGTPPETYVYAAGTTNFSITHQYLDDNPSGTSSDPYTITATLTDDDTGSDTRTTTVTVNNVNPTLTLTGPAAGTVNEGDFITVTGSATDPANQPLQMPTTINDPLTYTWSVTKDGNFYDNGVGNVANFQAVDNGVYVVTMTVSDDDLGSDTQTYTINVANVAPTPTVTGDTTGFEGTGINLVASSTDPANMPTTPTDNDSVTYSWSVTKNGNAYATGSGTNFTLTPDNEGVYVVTLTAADEDGGVRSTTHTIVVANVAPTPTINATDIDGQFYTYVDVSVADPGNDNILVQIVWGDINPDDFLFDPFVNGETNTDRVFPTVTHRYLNAPNPQDPLADVQVNFIVKDGTDTVIVTIFLKVTGQGIPAGGVYVTPEAEEIVVPVAQAAAVPPAILTQPAQQQVRNEEVVSREDTLTDEDARLVLHVVGPTGVEGPAVTLPDGLLKNLRSLFNKLPDGHYRVYLVQGESRRLVIEVFVRQGRAIDPAEVDQGTQERPPQSQPAAQQNPGSGDTNRVMQAEPMGQAVPDTNQLGQSLPNESADPVTNPSLDPDGSPDANLVAEQVAAPSQAPPDLREEPETAENADQTGVASLAVAGIVAGESWRRAARRQRAAAVTTGPDNGEKIEKTWSRLARRARQWKPR